MLCHCLEGQLGSELSGYSDTVNVNVVCQESYGANCQPRKIMLSLF